MKILLCVDDDPVLDAVLAALDWALETSEWDEILLLHVVRERPLSLAAREDVPNAAELFLSRVGERISHLPVAIETLAQVGDPATSIVGAADEAEVDLILMGALGERRDFLIGSVSQKVLALTSADVLVVRPRPDAVDPSESFRALVAVDGSKGSEAAIASFIQKLRAQQAAIRLLHVVDALPSLWEVTAEQARLAHARQHADRVLKQAAKLFEARGLATEREWRQGSAAAQILEAARDESSDLIVVGSHGESGLKNLLLGTIAQRILRHAPCSVLCARPWAPEWLARMKGWASPDWEPRVGMA